jgi:TolB-like protein
VPGADKACFGATLAFLQDRLVFCPVCPCARLSFRPEFKAAGICDLLYSFDDFRLDTDRRELRQGAKLIATETKVFDLLEFLIQNCARVVSRGDLIETIWEGRIVSESALSTTVNAARSAVGDSGKEQRLIRTFTRKGFRFVGHVREERSEVDPGTALARTSALQQPPALPLPDIPSIVVLSFANLSTDPGQGYFAEGIVEDITVALGRLPGLFVIGSGTAFTYKDRSIDARQVGAELGVRYVLRGSVRKDADRVRTTAELADATHNGQIWADRFEGKFESIFAMQDQVAAHVCTMIAPALRVAEINRTERKPTGNLTAYDLVLQASRRYRESFELNMTSLRLLNQAIKLDPSYGGAYGLAAFCYFWQKAFGWTTPSDPRLKEGVQLAYLAAERGNDDSEALWMAAQALQLLAGDIDRVIAMTEKSLLLNPNSPGAWQASAAAHACCGDTSTALDHAERARRHSPLDPLSSFYSSISSFIYFWAGRYEEAADAIEEILKRQPNFPPALRMQIATYGILGRVKEGKVSVERLRALNPSACVATLRDFFEAPLRGNPSALENFLEGLRLSGMPEE